MFYIILRGFLTNFSTIFEAFFRIFYYFYQKKVRICEKSRKADRFYAEKRFFCQICENFHNRRPARIEFWESAEAICGPLLPEKNRHMRGPIGSPTVVGFWKFFHFFENFHENLHCEFSHKWKFLHFFLKKVCEFFHNYGKIKIFTKISQKTLDFLVNVCYTENGLVRPEAARHYTTFVTPCQAFFLTI